MRNSLHGTFVILALIILSACGKRLVGETPTPVAAP